MLNPWLQILVTEWKFIQITDLKHCYKKSVLAIFSHAFQIFTNKYNTIIFALNILN